MGKQSARKRAAREAAASPQRPTVVFGPSAPADAEAILDLSRTRLPVALPLIERYAEGRPSPFEPRVARELLLEFSVARIDGRVVGYAYKQPFPRPGGQGYEPEVANLVFLAANVGRSGLGIGNGLLRECAVRAKATGAKLITAHVPTEAITLYERAGWTVLAADRGLAWQLPGGILYGDYPKAALPFPHLAYKQLGQISYAFDFANDGSAPVHQATQELRRQVRAGEIDERMVSDIARRQIAISAQIGTSFGPGATPVRRF
ncbi:GNAT family N-acetyltransferase [Microbacterium sp. zg.Y625]|uniref:GNAT family N-acetyltransferase n=1 Tax=Microbacterium jiangjiandongii TaxID=3049071 RepID=UPI00214B714A|nr:MULTISPECIES: GNAT family N-acetyltransferase [unclassified Microbacterium]MCR2791694.1 GNAT family N-acetyltransferase [Microbacterium sp. zg.Y625]WIM24512.1 GNAT family N-acetyltransferase [Microbacterium sp. zg-Y625]